MGKPFFPNIFPDIRPIGASGYVLASDPSNSNLLAWIKPTGIGATGFFQLVDVNVAGAATGDWLRYNGIQWVDVTGVPWTEIGGTTSDILSQYIYKSPTSSSRNVITPAASNINVLELKSPTATGLSKTLLVSNTIPIFAVQKTGVSAHSHEIYFNGQKAQLHTNALVLATTGVANRQTAIMLSLDTPVANSGIFYLPSGIGTSGYALATDGRNSVWVPVTASLSGLLDVDLSGATSGDYLRYNGLKWVDGLVRFSDVQAGVSTKYLVVSGTLLPSGGGIIDANKFNSNAIIDISDGGTGADGSSWPSGAVLHMKQGVVGVSPNYFFIDYERGHVAIGSGNWNMGSGNSPRGFLTLGEGTSRVPPLKFISQDNLLSAPNTNDAGSVEFVSASGIAYIDNAGTRVWLADTNADINGFSGILDVSKGGTSVTGFVDGSFVFASGNALKTPDQFLYDAIPVQTTGYPNFLQASSSGYLPIVDGNGKWVLIPQGAVLASGSNFPENLFVRVYPTGSSQNDVLTYAGNGHALILRSRSNQTAMPFQIRASGSSNILAGFEASGIIHATSGIYFHNNSFIRAYPSGNSWILMGSTNGSSAGGTINLSSNNANDAGSIDLAAKNGGPGGDINLYSAAGGTPGSITMLGGSSAAGGSITTSANTSNAGGSLDTSAAGGGRGGNIDTSASAAARGGDINTSAGTNSAGGDISTFGDTAKGGSIITRGSTTTVGASGGSIATYGGTNPGGSIATYDGGGSIDTRSGFIELGVDGDRTTLETNSSLPSNNTLQLPTGDGTLARYQDVFALRPNTATRNKVFTQKPEVGLLHFVRATGDQNTTLFAIEQQTGESLLEMFYFYSPDTVRINMFDDVANSVIRLYGDTRLEFYNVNNQRPVVLRHNPNTTIASSGGNVFLPSSTGILALLTDISSTTATGFVYDVLSSGNYLRFNGDHWVNIASIDHADLFGLGEDDHAHYIYNLPSDNVRNDVVIVNNDSVGLCLHSSSGVIVQTQYPLVILDPFDNDVARFTNTFDPAGSGSIVSALDLFDNVLFDLESTHGRVRLRNNSYVDFYNFADNRTLSLKRPDQAEDGVVVYLPSGDGNLKTIELTSLGDLNNVATAVDSTTSGYFLKFDGTGWVAGTGSLGGAGVSDHGALTGLEDDDHPQYPMMTGITAGRNVFRGADSGVVPIDIRPPHTLGTTQRLFNIDYGNGNSAMRFNVTNGNVSTITLGSGAIIGGNPCNLDLYGQFNFYGYLNPARKTTVLGGIFQANNAQYFFNNFGGNQSFVSTACVSNQASGFVFRNTSMPASGKMFASNGNGIYAIDNPVTGLELNDLADVSTGSATSGDSLVYNGVDWVNGSPSVSSIRSVYCYYAGGASAFQSFIATNPVLVTGHFTVTAGGIEYDPNGWYTKADGSLKFFPDVSGLYEIGLLIRLESFSDEYILSVLRNGVTYCTLDAQGNTVAAPIVAGGTTMIALDGTDDYIQFTMQHGDGASRNCNQNGGAIFTAKLIDGNYA